ncbi:MAG TPA: MMPL family transporter [bacterium]|nr:MMPL family transporter [bacterium]
MVQGLLRRYARWLYAHPKTVIGVALALTVVSLFGSIFFLKSQTGILDLYSENTPTNRRFLSYTKKFGAVEYLILVFEGSQDAERRAAMDLLAQRLAQDPHHYVRDVFYKVDLGLFKRHAFQFMSPNQAEGLLQQAESPDGGVRALFEARSWPDFLEYFNLSLEKGLREGKSSDAKAGDFAKLIQPLVLFKDFLEGQKLDSAAIANRLEAGQEAQANVDEYGYLRTDDGKMHLMLIRPVDSKQDYKVAEKLVGWVRQQIKTIGPESPGVSIGVTGGPALNDDQFRISRKDMTLASIFAYVSTAVIFILAFHSFARPFLGLLNLNLTMTWVFGFATLTVGHLNLFSMAFIVILVGQGTYYGVHVVARYEEELQKGRGIAQAIEETIAHVFGNIMTSATTTAAAFYATTLVELKGFAELGWIAGNGILISALSMIFVLPAFLALWDRRRSGAALKVPPMPPGGPLRPWMQQVRNFFFGGARWIVAAVVVIAAWGAYMFFSPNHGIDFDNNLLNLQAKNTEAVRYEKKLIDTSMSPRAGIFMTGSLGEAERIAAAAAKLPTVQRVEWLGAVFPERQPSGTTARLRRVILELPDAALAEPDPRELQSQLSRLKANLEEVQNRALSATEGEKIVAAAEDGIAAIDAALAKFPAPTLDAGARRTVESLLTSAVSEFQSDFFGGLRGTLKAAAASPPMRLEELPSEIRDRFLSADGTYAIYAYPKVNIWERGPLEAFIGELRQVSGEVTGPPVMFFEILRLVRKDYFRAGFYSAIAIFLLFLIDFRSLRYALLSSLPLVFGVFSLFGLMSLFDLPFNTANMIALPMILGIGADNGVHILHRFREEGANGLDFLFKSTGKAVLITYLDSMTSFVGMAFASHQGLAQLGKVVVLGLTCCMFMGMFFLPAVMSLYIRRKRRAETVPMAAV